MILPNQSTSPISASPEVVPGVSGAPVSGGLSQEEMKNNLQDIMSKIENKYQNFNSDKFSSDNLLREKQSESFRKIFDLFQSAGVDLTNIEEVKNFLDNLKAKNPELSQQIEQVLRNIIGGELPGPTDGISTGQDSNIPVGQYPNISTGQDSNIPTGQDSNIPAGQYPNIPTGQDSNIPVG